MTKFQEGQLDALKKLRERMIGRVVGGTLTSSITKEDINKLEHEIKTAKEPEGTYSAKGVF